jgi:methyl-accepting chemotaxis protein/methyl-accepting chemotaxis protein-1 (serine sensor receptor)
MKLSNLTMGKKLGISVGLMLAVTAALAVASLSAIANLGNIFDTAANEDAKKLELAGSIAVDAAQMLSFERGMLVRSGLNDLATAESYHNSFNESFKLAAAHIGELRKMAKLESAIRDLDALSTAISAWAPADQEAWEAVHAKRPKDALKIQVQRALPLGKDVGRIANDLREHETVIVAASVQRGRAVVSSSRWVTIALIALFGAAALIVSVVVRRSGLDLKQMASALSDSAGQISSAAGQVAASSQALAQGASEQAASLEETSASTEEITSMVRKNAENSQGAAEVMTMVDRHVKDGNRTIEQMVVSMHEISSSSDKISKIIKVIDEIAFQTNILALNAAVEAARAGEAGMGFAVVADEVRNLAQRSAQAAKDTASLIEESIAKSGHGSTKLQEVTGVIRAITESAAKVKTMVDEVSLSSQEQARGIDQIARAVTQMDQTTQSTAASAEQSASASEELSAQAEAMKQVVHQLRTMVGGENGAGQTSAAQHGSAAKRNAPPLAPAKSGRRALSSAVARPAPKAHAKPALAYGKDAAGKGVAGNPDRSSFPLDDDFKEI